MKRQIYTLFRSTVIVFLLLLYGCIPWQAQDAPIAWGEQLQLIGQTVANYGYGPPIYMESLYGRLDDPFGTSKTYRVRATFINRAHQTICASFDEQRPHSTMKIEVCGTSSDLVGERYWDLAKSTTISPVQAIQLTENDAEQWFLKNSDGRNIDAGSYFYVFDEEESETYNMLGAWSVSWRATTQTHEVISLSFLVDPRNGKIMSRKESRA